MALCGGPREQDLQGVGLNRLLEKPERAEIVNRLERILDAAECSEDDGHRSAAVARELFQ